MAVRKFKPVTPGQRHKIIGTFEEITASVPEKSLVYGKRSTGGRNNTGKMTVRYMGGGHKKKYRVIDFKREKDGVPAVVKTIEYDPNRSRPAGLRLPHVRLRVPHLDHDGHAPGPPVLEIGRAHV